MKMKIKLHILFEFIWEKERREEYKDYEIEIWQRQLDYFVWIVTN